MSRPYEDRPGLERYAAPAPGRGVYVTEFASGRISLLADGARSTVAAVPQPGPIMRTRNGTLVVGSLDASISGIDSATGRVRRLYP